ncbi:MAG: 2'-5' RNA ligase family protein [Promethearchaeota archaeon]
MTKVYTSAVVIIPPQDQWNSIQEIRRKYDRHIHRWMPHITLLYPFRPKLEFDTLGSNFKGLCKSIEAFQISLGRFNYFSHGKQNYTIWLNPEPIDLIKSLQARILGLTPDCNDVNMYKYGFTPHLSLGQLHGRENLENTIKYLQKNWKLIQFPLNDIYFISREKSQTSKFEIKKRIPLKK